MASKASEVASSKAKARQVVVIKDGKLEVTDQVAASKQKVKALPAWLTQGPDVAATYVDDQIKGMSKETLAAFKEMAVAVATLHNRVEQLD